MQNSATVNVESKPQQPVSGTPKPATTIGVEPNFGNTRYSAFGKEVYKDAIRILHYSPEIAEKLARAAMADVGVLVKAEAKVSIGGLKKADDTFTIKEVASMKGVVATNAIRIVKLMAELQGCVKWGLRFGNSDFDVDDNVEGWLYN